MIAQIILTPLCIGLTVVLPLLATCLSLQNSSKWVIFWITQILATLTIAPLIGAIFGS